MQSELEDATLREDIRRQRRLKTAIMKESGKTDCENCLDECCCRGCSQCCAYLLKSGSHGSAAGDDEAADAVDGCGDCAFLQLLLYTVFPAFAVTDFLLGLIARNQGWYEDSIGQMVCSWSLTACAVWIALGICGLVLATATVVNALCACCAKKDRRRRSVRRRNKEGGGAEYGNAGQANRLVGGEEADQISTEAIVVSENQSGGADNVV